VPLEDAEKALVTLMAPDRYSRTTDHEGRRIEAIDGGWRLLNHAKYRDIRDEEVRREQNREAQERKRQRESADLLTVSHDQPPSAHAEAYTDTKKSKTIAGALPGFGRFWSAWPTGERKQAEGRCLEVWKKKGFENIAVGIIAHVEAAKKSADWLQGFVPAPLVYLNQRRWEGADASVKPRRVPL
jgi:hypothetical protein